MMIKTQKAPGGGGVGWGAEWTGVLDTRDNILLDLLDSESESPATYSSKGF